MVGCLSVMYKCYQALKLITFLKSRGEMLAQNPEEAPAETVNLGAQHTEKHSCCLLHLLFVGVAFHLRQALLVSGQSL